MFSGHIRHVGEVEALGEARYYVRAPGLVLGEGAQIAVAGVRTSVAACRTDGFEIELSPETRASSTLPALADAHRRVNLEAPLRVGDALQGHLVQGHVDAVGEVVRVEQQERCRRVRVCAPESVLARLVARAAVSVDGVSLSVASVDAEGFELALVPATLAATTLGELAAGDRVNLEVDLFAKYLRESTSAQDRDKIARCIAPEPWAGVVTGAEGVQMVVQQLRAGGAVLVWDPDREVEGDIVVAGEKMREEHFTHILTEACCHPTVPCAGEVLERLEIPAMAGKGDHTGTWMYTPVDLAAEPGTGVSAAQRAATVRRLAAPDARPEDFVMPGHVFPLRARAGRVAERAGHTEATVALCEAAGLAPVGVCCEVMNKDGTMAGPAELERRALEWQLPLIDMRDLVRYL